MSLKSSRIWVLVFDHLGNVAFLVADGFADLRRCERSHCLDELLYRRPDLSNLRIMFCDDLDIVLNEFSSGSSLGLVLFEPEIEIEFALDLRFASFVLKLFLLRLALFLPSSGLFLHSGDPGPMIGHRLLMAALGFCELFAQLFSARRRLRAK